MKTSAALVLVLLALSAVPVPAEERAGLRVEIVPKIVENRSAPTRSVNSVISDVDKNMSLKATVKNVSMKDMPEGSIDYVILVHRWTGTEQQSISQYTGKVALPPLRTTEQVEVDVGNYHIGGHRHGTSSRHEDKLVGWKLSITQGGVPVEFRTPTTFEELNRKAKPSVAKPAPR